MASTKSRLIRLLSGTRTVVSNIPSYDTATEMLIRDLTVRRIEGDYQSEDRVSGFEGAQGDRLYNVSMGLDFSVDGALPAAGDAPLYGAFLRACGLTQTLTVGTSASYSLTPEGTAKHEIALQYVDTLASQVTEKARGALTFTAETKKPPMFGFKFMGEHFDGQATVATTQEFSSWPDAPECTPRNMSAFTVDGTELCLQSFTLTDGRAPVRNKYMNCDGTDITPRNVTGRMVVEMVSAASFDLLGLCKSGAKQSLVWEIGNGEGRNLRVAAPAVQLKYGGEQDINGEMGIAIDLVFTPDQGDDEFAIMFS
jgi:hypothetical protein